MNKMNEPIIMDLPLRGEWFTPNSPGIRIPSHGTNLLGTRYAYDFLQVDWTRKGFPSYSVSPLQYLLSGVPINKCYCWGQDIFAPCDGIIVEAKDGYAEREKVQPVLDMYAASRIARSFNPRTDNVQMVAGNFVVIKCKENVYAGLVHMQTGSIQVSVGQNIKKGDIIGRVGHSGNSLSPHLHFQLMDSSNIVIAKGLPCAFEQYEVFRNGIWQKVHNGIPTDKDRIRYHNT